MPKSEKDIMYQYDRLTKRAMFSESRIKRIQEIADRYLKNISNTKQYQKDRDDFLNAPTFAAKRQADYRQQNRKYSQRQYMGLSNG